MQNTAKFYLVRRQQNNKGWKKRWVVFDGHELRYYKDKVNPACQRRLYLRQ